MVNPKCLFVMLYRKDHRQSKSIKSIRNECYKTCMKDHHRIDWLHRKRLSVGNHQCLINYYTSKILFISIHLIIWCPCCPHNNKRVLYLKHSLVHNQYIEVQHSLSIYICNRQKPNYPSAVPECIFSNLFLHSSLWLLLSPYCQNALYDALYDSFSIILFPTLW